MSWHYALDSNDIKNETMKRIVIEKEPVLIVKHKDKVYALEDRCPHLKASLAKGQKEDEYVICAKHGAKINFINGEIAEKAHMFFIKMPTKKAAILATKEEYHKIFVQI